MFRFLGVICVVALLAFGYYGLVHNSTRGQNEFVKVEVTPEPPKVTQEQLEQDRKVIAEAHKTMIDSAKFQDVGGDASAGSVIVIAGKDVQLPGDVMVEALIVSGMCVQDRPCPETPLYVLKYTDGSDDKISVSVNSGVITIDYPEKADRLKERFGWLYQVLGVK